MSKLKALSKRTKVILVSLVSIVLVLLVASGARAALSDPDGQYRYFEIANGAVREVVSTSGTITSSGRSEAESATSGIVKEVRVSTGSQVSANQILVVLDRTSAKSAYLKAKATLDQAKASLENIESGQGSTVSSSKSSQNASSDAVNSGSGASSSGGQKGGNGSESIGRLKENQKQVKTKQSATTKALRIADEALKQQVTVCGAQANEEGAAQSDSDVSEECQQALNAVQEAQGKASLAQSELQKSLDSLIDQLAKAAKETEAAAQQLAKQSSSSRDKESGSSETSSGSSSGNGSAQVQSNATASAASLAQAQAAVDSAQADLVEARQALGAILIRASRSGKIAGVEVVKGDQVSVGDSVAVVLGNGGAVVNLSLTGANVSQVKTGQSAEVTVIGSTDPLSGKVGWVSPVSSSQSLQGFTTNASYAATIEVSKSELSKQSFPQGVQASVEIEVGNVDDTLVVPNSALSSRSSPTVRVLQDGEVATKSVEIGLLGSDVAQVTGGLEIGQKVVLADLNAEIDAAGEVNSNNGPGRGMGPPGGMSGGPGGAGRGTGSGMGRN